MVKRPINWKNDIADAVLLVNHFMTIADDFAPGDPSTSPTGILRRVQTQLLEAYRQEINEPWSRFYMQKAVGGGSGVEKKKAAAKGYGGFGVGLRKMRLDGSWEEV